MICNVSGSYIYPAIAVVSALMFSLYLVAEEDRYFTNDDVMQYLFMAYSFMHMETPLPTSLLGMSSLMMAASRCEVSPEILTTGCAPQVVARSVLM